MTTVSLPKKVRIVEVGPRDGLQNISHQYGLKRDEGVIPTKDKVAFVDALSESGLPDIEMASFVSPKAVPQMGDGLDVSKQIERNANATYWALVPNMRGLETAIEAGIKHIAVFTAASNLFNQANINKTIDEAFDAFKPVIEKAKSLGMTVRGYVSTAFYCPYLAKEEEAANPSADPKTTGKVDKEVVREVTQKLLDMGIDEVSIGDTIGKARPEDVKETVGYLLKTIPADKLAMHFHDTYGNALDNIRESLKLGITTYDSSVGGFGGCPYAPGASGNVSTQAVVRLMEQLGIETGVDLTKLEKASTMLEEILKRTQVPAS